ncbi:MAG: ORF6N domain-containing protein [Sodaliphilus sp.]|nr:ORF6N domain-containing protein [Bacteroidales bacterium]MDY5009602.1 ORF6N domain-containing protein [Sodaliphilus sp.]MCI6576726.1 ORF6N domain-containing protein [Bacteroidales bacterium]MDD7575848.1 ORF6N domain-containing protein [Bacteroidales bacterium]MDY5229185.1 ORF6N domain-containing protein [Sodaliphilus sp.]
MEEKQNIKVGVSPTVDNQLAVPTIQSKIALIRDQQVLLDRDLARFYGVEVSQMNRQVKRNIERFPEDFMFQLTKAENDALKCQYGISKQRGGDRRLPYAFTEQGVAMLSGLLRSEVAIAANIMIMRAFVTMRRFLTMNAQIYQRLDRIEGQQLMDNQWRAETESKIETILDKLEEKTPSPTAEQIFATGCIWDAWQFVSELIRGAKVRIILIDNYVDDRVLTLLCKRKEGVSATIHTRYNQHFLLDLEKHNQQYSAITAVQIPHKHHDRFLVIDDVVYLLGASVKDMGTGLCAITRLVTKPEEILEMIK